MSPAAPDSGIVFRRLDAGADIRARWENTIESSLSTVLSNGEGIRVSTIEHLMAALAGSGVDNAIVELDGPEVPILDGSAAPFLHLIESAGAVAQDEPRRAIKILQPVAVSDGEAIAALLPDHGFSLSFEIDFANPLINRQDMAVTPDTETFRTELAPARTFGLLDDLHVVADRLQIISIGDVAMARMQLNEAIGGNDRLVVVAGFILRIHRHQLALGGPDRIGVLALNLLEGLGRLGVALVDDRVHRLVVEVVDRLFDVDFVFRISAADKRDQQHRGAQPRRRKQLAHYWSDPQNHSLAGL